MSVQALSWVFDEVRGLSPVQRLVLLSIANHADKYGGNAWPSIDTISEEADITRRTTVKDALRFLRDEGWIEVEVQRGGNADMRADRRPNRYTLTRMRTPVDNPPDGGPVGGTPHADGGPVGASRGAAERANGGPVGGPQTVLEPSSMNAEQSAVDACERCDKNGWVIPDVDDRNPPARKCDHRIGALAGGQPIEGGA